jgi:methylated-DNA-[protein]-cysteine S-methyltransferase
MTAIALKFHVVETEMGWVGLVLSTNGLRATTLPLPTRDAAMREATDFGAAEPASEAEAGDIPDRIRDVVSGTGVADGLSIDWNGLSGFRQSVLEETRRIPAGETRSYGWIAAKVGSPRAARAVGRVMATNPLPLVVPCHRVIGSDGGLHGFGGGLPMKEALLQVEGAR